MKIDHSTIKRARFTDADFYFLDSDFANLNLTKQKFGREIRVLETSAAKSSALKHDHGDPPEDFYTLKPEDYYRLITKKKGEDCNVLKTRKIREAEEAARRSKITRSTIRVRFPDNHTLEAVFHPSEKIQTLVDLLKKVVSRPDVPFYLYTTPPKKQLKDLSQDFYSAGFIPGAIVYFAYDLRTAGDAPTGTFLSNEVMELLGLKMEGMPDKPILFTVEPSAMTEVSARPVVKPANKMTAKPKWLRM